jgi:hypothetical protein
MRKLAFKLVLFLLLGAIVNVAVAWGLVSYTKSMRQWNRLIASAISDGVDHANWVVVRRESVGSIRITSTWFDDDARIRVSAIGRLPAPWPNTLVPSWAPHLLPEQHRTSGMEHACIADARGWPCLALWSGAIESRQIMQPQRNPVHLHALVLDRAAPNNYPNYARMIPLAPLWPGFLINTAIYSGALLVLYGAFLASPWMRRVRRRRRGQCIHCGYDLRGDSHDRCPECGKAIRQNVAVHGAAAPCNPCSGEEASSR